MTPCRCCACAGCQHTQPGPTLPLSDRMRAHLAAIAPDVAPDALWKVLCEHNTAETGFPALSWAIERAREGAR